MTTILNIRNKILEQAIRGELVAQNDNDEDASLYLQEIQEEKVELIKNGIIKKQQSLPKIDPSEVPFELPSGWIWVRLGELGLTQTGTTPSTKNKEYFNGEYPFIKPADIDDKGINYKNESLTKEGIAKGRLIERNSVMMVCIGGSIGKTYYTDRDCSCNQQINTITGFAKLNSQFLYYFMSSPFFLKNVIENSTGSATPIIKKSSWEKLLFPLPPKDEQDKILDKIKNLFELCDRWKNEVTLQQKNIQSLRENVLRDALHGLIVSQNEEDEPASFLLKKIQNEKEQLIKEEKLKKTKPLPSIEEDEVSHELPSGWTWVRIGDIAQINPRNAIDDDLDVGFVPMRLVEDGYSGQHISETRKWSEVKKGFTHFQENDIAIAKITPCFENRKSAIMKDLANGYGAGTTELHIVRPFHDYILVDFLMCLFKSNSFIDKGVQTYTGTAGQQRVGKDFIGNYVIGLPPLAEQYRIVEKVNSVWDTINEIESNIIPIK